MDIKIQIQTNQMILRWCEHVERKSNDDWIKKCQQSMVEGKAG